MSPGSKILVNGVNLYYEKVGKGDHVLLLMPGVLGCIRTDFEPNLKLLNLAKFTVVAFDPRGFGNSRPPDRDFPVDYLHRDADDAAAIMKALGFDFYSIAGWSDGSNAACILAAKYSDRIRKLVLWGGNSYFTREDLACYQGIRDLTSWSGRMKQPAIEIYGTEYLEKTWHAYIDFFGNIFKQNSDQDGNTDMFNNLLPDIKAETLVIHGRKDPMVPLFHAENIHKNIKNSRLEVWDDAKHNLHLRFPGRFNTLLEDFLTASSRL